MDDAQNSLVNTHSIDIKNYQNGTKPKKVSVDDSEDCFVPPDGGTRAWIVMVCSFFCNGILFGVINSSGVFHKEFSRYLEAINDTEASRKAALVESLSMGTLFVVSPVAGVLTDTIGLRMTTFLGGAIASGGMFLSSFCDYNVEALYFTFGIMFGLGGALAYTPSLAILGHYFKGNLGIVNGVVTAGSSTFTVIMAYLIDWLLKNAKLGWTFRVLAIFAAAIMGCALLFKPLNVKAPSKKMGISCGTVFNVSIWKNKKYVIWALVVPFSLFGYFVPYVHMNKFVESAFPKDVDGKLPVTCISITSFLGRLLFGYIADLPRVNRVLLQQISILSMGVLTMLIPVSEGSFTWLIVISLCMGLFDGCFISLLGPIAFELCGRNGATQAIGFLLGLCSCPLTLGPFLAGMLYDKTASYEKAFVYAGIPPVIGSVLLLLIRCVKTPKTISNDPSEEPLQYHKNLNNEQLKGTHSLDIKANGKLSSSDTVDDRPEEEPNIRQ